LKYLFRASPVKNALDVVVSLDIDAHLMFYRASASMNRQIFTIVCRSKAVDLLQASRFQFWWL